MQALAYLILVFTFGAVNVKCEHLRKNIFPKFLGSKSKSYGSFQNPPRHSELISSIEAAKVSLTCSGGEVLIGSSPKRSFFLNIFRSREAQESSPSSTTVLRRPAYNPLRMYLRCMVIVMVWITSGTLFYSICNNWPLPQSFFYAVDAGLSFGFC